MGTQGRVTGNQLSRRFSGRGASIVGDKAIRTTLQNHYGKSCTGRKVGRHPSEWERANFASNWVVLLMLTIVMVGPVRVTILAKLKAKIRLYERI